MANDKEPKDNRGQQKLHTIVNPTTGETKQITQAEWRRDGKALRAAGFQRPDDIEDDTPDEPTPGV